MPVILDGHEEIEFLVQVCETAMTTARLSPKANDFANRLSQELTEHLAICGHDEGPDY